MSSVDGGGPGGPAREDPTQRQDPAGSSSAIGPVSPGRRQPPPPPAGSELPVDGVGHPWPPRRIPPPVPTGIGRNVDWAAASVHRSPPPRRRGAGALVGALVLALTAATVGAGVGAAIARRGQSSSAPSDFALVPPPHRPAQASAADLAIAAKVDPAVVDVNTTLGLDNGAAAGTGMIITASGEVLTNNHVVDGATKVTVQIDGSGPTYIALVLGTDVTDDIALLQIQGASGLKPVTLGDSSRVEVGDRVVATGNALGLQGPPTVVGGTITALGQSITASEAGGGNAESLSGLLQTDAPLRPGDSGGPLVNASADVIGMNTAASGGQRSRFASSVAFAIPINAAMSVVSQIEAGRGSATVHIGAAALLGVEIRPTGTSVGSVPAAHGAVVAGVTPKTPAEVAGLAVGDTIVSVDGKAVTSPSDLTQRIGDHHPGDSVTIEWMDASNKLHSATVRLATGPTR